VRIEEEAGAIVEQPVRPRIQGPASLDRLLDHIDAPVALFIDATIRIPQDVSNIPAKIQNVLSMPHCFAHLLREVGELSQLL
jgi:hypothetical protein